MNLSGLVGAFEALFVYVVDAFVVRGFVVVICLLSFVLFTTPLHFVMADADVKLSAMRA